MTGTDNHTVRQVNRALSLVATLRAFAQLERGDTPDKNLYVARLGCWLMWRCGLLIRATHPLAENQWNEAIDSLEWEIRNPLGFYPGDELSASIRAMCLGNQAFDHDEVCEELPHAIEDFERLGVDVSAHRITICRLWPQYEICRQARGF